MAVSRAAVVALAAIAMLAVGAAAQVVVVTDAGPVRGVEGDAHRAFYGVPFGKPPVGDLRWASPQRAEPWTEVRDASEPGNMWYARVGRGRHALGVLSAGRQSRHRPERV